MNVCGFNLKDSKKSTELREVLALEPAVSLYQLGGVGYCSLDMLNEKMMHTHWSDVWRWSLREPG